MRFMNWYRVRIPHDTWTARDVGRVFPAEGTVRMAALEAGGFVEQVVELQPQPVVERIPMSPLAKAASVERPRGTTRLSTRRRRGTAEVGSDESADLRLGEGGGARGEDGPADRDGGETAGPDEEAGPAA